MSESTTGRVPAVSVTFFNGNDVECGPAEGAVRMVLTFADGTSHTVTSENLSNGLQRAYMWHGAKQKFIDAGAISRNPETGRSATVADKKAAILEVIDRCIVHGQWNKTREGGGSGTLLLEALVRMYAGKKDRAALVEYLDGLMAEQKRQLERNPRVAPIIEAIRTERRLASGKADDGEDLLAQLD